jgi:hypothetical protein
LATVKRMSPMATALKKYSDTRRSIFSTAKEQGEQQRANRESIEFEQKGLDLKRDFQKKQDKINTANAVLGLAQTITSAIGKGQEIQAGGEQLAAEAGEDFNVFQTSDKYGADKPFMNFLEGIGQGFKKAFGAYDKNYQIGDKTYSQQELKYLSKFPGADTDLLGYTTPATNMSESIGQTISETQNTPVNTNSTNYSDYTNEYGEQLFTPDPDNFTLPKLNQDGSIALLDDGSIETETFIAPTENINLETTKIQYYQELNNRSGALKGLSDQLEDSLFEEINKDMDVYSGMRPTTEGEIIDPSYGTISTTFKDRDAIIRDGLLYVDMYEPNIDKETGLDTGKVIKVVYDKFDDESGFYDTSTIENQQNLSAKRNSYIKEGVSMKNIDIEKDLLTNKFFEAYGKEKVRKLFGEDFDLSGIDIGINAKGEFTLFGTRGLKNRKKFKKLEAFLNANKMNKEYVENRKVPLEENIIERTYGGVTRKYSESDIDAIDMDISDVGETTDAKEISFNSNIPGYSKEDVALAMDVWYNQFPNEQYTHEKYGYNWAQNYINQVGLVTAETTTNLTVQDITEPWNIPNEKTRDFVMNKLNEFYDIRLTQEQKDAININNVSDGSPVEVNLNNVDIDSNKEIIDSLDKLQVNTTAIPGIPQVFKSDNEELIDNRNERYVDDHSAKTDIEKNFNDFLKINQESSGLGIKSQEKNEFDEEADSTKVIGFDFYKNYMRNRK